MVFNMHEAGRIIARHRKAHNMTQMELADRMNVSFQAVSNWERGQSMPDISKLPELAACFGVSIDELLGRNVPLITHAAEDNLTDYLAEHDISISEMTEAAPLLKPNQMETLEEKLLELPVPPAANGQPAIGDLLPFLSTDAVEQLMQRYLDAGDDAALTSCLPFASTAKLASIAEVWDAQDKPIQPLLPFLSTDAVEQLMQRYLDAGDDAALTACLPFASTAKLASIAEAWDAQDKPIQPLLPFLSTEKVEQFAEDWLRKGKAINAMLPFLSGDFLARLAAQALNQM